MKYSKLIWKVLNEEFLDESMIDVFKDDEKIYRAFNKRGMKTYGDFIMRCYRNNLICFNSWKGRKSVYIYLNEAIGLKEQDSKKVMKNIRKVGLDLSKKYFTQVYEDKKDSFNFLQFPSNP